MNNYDDIIDFDRPISKYPKMQVNNRAAQFAPFAALTGYSSAIKETARLTTKRKELTNDEKLILNSKLQIINDNINSNLKVMITYFVPDLKKTGGEYISKSGIVKKINLYNNQIILNNNDIIPIYEIVDIKLDI